MSAQARPTLSEGFEHLRYRISQQAPEAVPDAQGFHCEVLIVGSGYGAAVCAAALGEHIEQVAAPASPPRVWLLERGQAYLPGEFPNQLAELPGHVRYNTPQHLNTKGQREGLFDVRVSDDVSVLLGNGLGGGSLINAGVMLWPQDEVFQQAPWPRAIAKALPELKARAARMQQALGAALPDGRLNTVELMAQRPVKHTALRRIARGAAQLPTRFTPTPITVAMSDAHITSGQVQMRACNGCGDCATGCNQGAKISLDTTLLARAAQAGVKLYTGATVMRVWPLPADPATGERPAGWQVQVQHTDQAMQWREGAPLVIQARRVILAAGTLGSTGILMRSRGEQLALSDRLGERFSANGDLVLAAFDQRQQVQAVVHEEQAVEQRQVGPTITGMIDRRPAAAHASPANLQDSHVVQDLAVPGALARFFGELNTTANAIHQLGKVDTAWHGTGAGHAAEADSLAVQPAQLARTFPLAIIGHDRAQGRIEPCKPPARPPMQDDAAPPFLESDSAFTISWPELRHDPRFDRQLQALKALCQSSATGGTLLPNPGWQPMPQDMAFLVDGQRGPLFTAHPLGGCAMGSSTLDGVVDQLGRVFQGGQGGQVSEAASAQQAASVHEGLVVLDGAIIPTSLGINPSLTIATLADRAIRQLMQDWFKDAAQAPADHAAAHTVPRTVVEATPLPAPQSTWIEIVEQLRGHCGRLGIELTLRFEEVAIAELIAPHAGPRQIKLDAQHSFVRVVDRQRWPEHEVWDKAPVLLRARLSGHLLALQREPSSVPQRVLRAGGAWLLNRGLRDITQHVLGQLAGVQPPTLSASDVLTRAQNALALASRGGEVRRLDYQLRIEEVLQLEGGPWAGPAALQGQPITAHKRLTYARRSNPWEQLMTLTLQAFPGLLHHAPAQGQAEHQGSGQQGPAPQLKLNLEYLTQLGVPLCRITRQRDMPSALMDLASLALLFARMLINIHLWTMRATDAGPARQPNGRPGERPHRLPDEVPGLPPPVITELDLDPPLDDGTPVRVRLTRYPGHQRGRAVRPLVMLHGYSASSTTFAHRSVQPGLAKYLWDQGHDIWLVDLRTSAGMPTASVPWRFEDPALKDIPTALAYIADACGHKQLDVFAHCMGSAMLWIALSCDVYAQAQLSLVQRQALQRLQGGGEHKLPSLVHRLGMSQIAPIMHFSPGNLFRAFVMRYLRHFLPLGPYRFKPEPNDGATNAVVDQLLQRLLATLPYPVEEFDIENPLFPPWKTTPWARTRRRMDALYGRDFNLQHMGQAVLDDIDEHFGPLSLDTLSQGINFARNGLISDPDGLNRYLTQPRLAAVIERLDALMSVHGVDNGLSSIQGMHEFERYVQALGPGYACKYRTHAIVNRGHQDCLIGQDAHKLVFPHIAAFFNEGSHP